MTTVTGPWEGHGRIRIEYTRTYNSDHDDAHFVGDIYIETDVSVSDSVNQWAVESPNFSDDSGSNINISIGSGGGKKKFFDFDFWSDTDPEIYAEVENVEYFGQRVEHDFTLSVGDLAPKFHNGGSTTAITSTGFSTTGISAEGNGGTLNNVQLQHNTSASSSGATTVTKGSYGNVTVTGLNPATTYYWRTRVSNNTYGYSSWSSWRSFTTLSTVPDPPSESWSIVNIGQTDALAQGFSTPDNGGAAIDSWLVRVNTTAVDAGGTDFTVAPPGTSKAITGLLPGTTYWAKLYVHNANGWAGSAWRSFSTLPGVSVNVGGVWKNAQPYVNVGGVWKSAVRYVNVGGVWKQ